ncbi:MAG: biotin--[acetyl-CoA-carboxylase] ligase [Pyrinomonadaceae bacterium]
MVTGQTFTPKFVRLDTIGSTNTEALRLAQLGAPEGTCVLAREQTAGRGRQDRSWSSVRDAGLYLSLVLRPRLPVEQWPVLTLMTAVAVQQTLVEIFGLVTDIKWPNDIVIADRKLAGILAETIDGTDGRAAVIGIGVNLRREAVSLELQEIATSLESETEFAVDAGSATERLAAEIVRALAQCYETLQSSDGLKQIVDAWSARSSFAYGKAVAVRTGHESFTGITQGLTEFGALRVRIETGEVRTLHSAELTALRPHHHQ